MWEEHSIKYFQKRGDENAIIEIECITKIIYVAIPILIILVTIYSLDLLEYQSTREIISYINKNLVPLVGQDFVTVMAGAYVTFLLIFFGRIFRYKRVQVLFCAGMS